MLGLYNWKEPSYPWRPSLGDAVKLAWGPIAAYLLFAGAGAFVELAADNARMAGFSSRYSADDEAAFIVLGGIAGTIAGFGFSLARVRLVPMVLGLVLALALGWVGVAVLPRELLALAFGGAIMLPSAYLALRHRFAAGALVAPTLAWLTAYRDAIATPYGEGMWTSKALATSAPTWSPLASASVLALYLLTLALYLASLQSMRVALWEQIPAAARAARAGDFVRSAALPHRRVIVRASMVACFAALTFGATLFLLDQKQPDPPPALTSQPWTEDEDREAEVQRVAAANAVVMDATSREVVVATPGNHEAYIGLNVQAFHGTTLDAPIEVLVEPGIAGFAASHRRAYIRSIGPARPRFDLRDVALVCALILALAMAKRPAKRALLSLFLRRPWVHVTASERIEHLWEWVRIVIADGGVVPGRSESVERLVERAFADRMHLAFAEQKRAAVERAAAIYAQSRYGFVLAPRALAEMQDAARSAVHALEADLPRRRMVTRWWRELS